MCVPEPRQEMCLLGAVSQDGMLSTAYLYSSQVLCAPAKATNNDFVS